ncbi:MAG: FtsX-like permease family protein [Syntrophomonas sp.]
MWYLAWRNTVRRRSQSVLTVVITGLTVFVLVMVFLIFLMVQEGLNLSTQRLGADIIVLPDKARANAYQTLFTGEPANHYMSKSTGEELLKIPGIAEASPQFFTQTLTGGCCSYGEEIRLVGYDQKTDFILRPYFNERNISALKDNEVIIGSKVEAHLGNVVAILGKPFTVAGTLYATGSGMDKTIFLDIDTARRLAGNIPELQYLWKNAGPDALVSSVLIKIKNSADQDQIIETINQSGLGVQAVSTSETINNMRSQIDAIGKIIFGLCLAALVIAMLSLLGRFNSLARERKSEIGLLRAIGIQKKQVFHLLVNEAWIMAFTGGLAGSLLACICIIPVLNLLEKTFVLPAGIWNWALMLKGVSVGVAIAWLLGSLASIHPAVKSAGLDPQEAISRGELE